MTLTVLNTTEDALIKFKYDPDKRDCYTETELFFRYMTYVDGFRYSMQNCLYESVLEVIIVNCTCVPAFANFRLNVDLPICRGESLNCALKWMDNFGDPNPVKGEDLDLTRAETNETFFDGLHMKMICKQRCESQEQILMSTSSSYPNRQTFPYREDFCLIMKKVVTRVCRDTQRKKAFENRYSESITCKEILDAYEGESKYIQIMDNFITSPKHNYF